MATRDEVIETLTAMSSRDLQELQATVERRWGISPVVTVSNGGVFGTSNPPASVRNAPTPADLVELRFTAFGADRIAILRSLREELSLSLADARDIVEGVTPRAWPTMRRDRAEPYAQRLRDELGCACEIVET